MTIKKDSEHPHTATDTKSNILGVNYSGVEPFAFVGEYSWNFHKLALTKKLVDKVMTYVDEYEQAVDSLAKGDLNRDAKFYEIYEHSTKGILETVLVDFKYTTSANNPDIGPALLGSLSGEVKDFLRAGGKPGLQHVQTRLNMMKKIS